MRESAVVESLLVVGVSVVAGILLLAFFVFSKKQVDEKQAAFDEKYQQWWSRNYELVTDPESDRDRMLDFAMSAVPQDETTRVATLTLFRLLVKNPSFPSDSRSGLIARIGAEEIAVRNDKKLSEIQRSISRSRFIVGGGFSFPID